MSDEKISMTLNFPKHKRARRKKYQKEYQERHKEEMMQQLGRRFQNQPSTSSAPPDTVEKIPLPTESTSALPFGDSPRLTEKDYETNYMIDPPVVSTHSAELIKSNRVVIKAEEAEKYMMIKAKSTTSKILQDFQTKILETVKTKRRLQADVPYIIHPCHSMKGRKTPKQKGGDESFTASDVSDDSNDSQDEASTSEPTNRQAPEADKTGEVKDEKQTCNRRNQQRKAKRLRNFEEKERQITLLKKGIDRKKTHPNGIHPDISFNEKGLGNEGPECRCPEPIKTCGLKHGYYAGEDKAIDCKKSNGENLHYYTLRVTPLPSENQLYRTHMAINGEEFEFEGFSLITHAPLPDCMTRAPICKYSMDYEFQLVEEFMPDECFDPEDCDMLFEYIFHEIFEMLDFELRPKHIPSDVESCPMIHIMPRFVQTKDDLVQLWSSKTVLAYFTSKGSSEIMSPEDVNRLCDAQIDQFTRNTSKHKQSIVLNTKFKPSAIRADWFERDEEKKEVYVVHNAIRAQTYTAISLPRIAFLEKTLNKMIQEKQSSGVYNKDFEKTKNELEHLKRENRSARNLKLREPVAGFIETGLKPDVAAHVVMTILACHHIRYNFSLDVFEEVIEYKFNDRRVIELALMHSSFKSHYGTPIDHVKNMITNCGYRRKYGAEDKREKKRGIMSLFNIMKGTSGGEPILHNERLEYLGDAVVELIVSHHLYFMLTHHFEGGLATYRTALVQNRNLATLAKNCRIDEMLQYSHGADLINVAEFKHALANAFEAVMAAIYLDGGLAPCDVIFSKAMYGHQPVLKEKWDHINEHELKREDPQGDRDLSFITPTLSTFHALEERLGIQFNNIRLLAKAFTRRNIPNNDLTKGHNQRLEWLGDSVLQLIVSDFLYRRFPYHHEGHMSLLRTSLVSNQTQAVVCDDLGFTEFVIKAPYKTPELKLKDKADLVEAFIGALYVDRGIEHCRAFIRIVFCPRLKHFIESEKWNDAKSHLQQWCLAMRDPSSSEPDMPEYRVLGIEGPTNNRIFKIAVYYKGKRLASAAESNVHKAELRVAELALANLESMSFSKMKAKNNSNMRRRLEQDTSD